MTSTLLGNVNMHALCHTSNNVIWNYASLILQPSGWTVCNFLIHGDSCICRSILPAEYIFSRIVNLKSEWEWFIWEKWQFMRLSFFKRTSLICSIIPSCSCLSVSPTYTTLSQILQLMAYTTLFSLQLTFDGTLYLLPELQPTI